LPSSKTLKYTIIQETHVRTTILLFALLGTLAYSTAQADECKSQPGQPCQEQKVSSEKSSIRSDRDSKQNKPSASLSKSGPNETHKNQQQAQKKPNNTPAAFQKSLPPKGMYIVKVNQLNIRNEPGHHAKVHGRFHGGQRVEVYDIINGWAKILLDGQFLWISAEHIQKAGN
jgi:uncharacterized protein YgiM (DUF1202 family)